MMAQRALALLLSLVCASCTSSAVVGRLGEVDAASSDASALDAARSDDDSDAAVAEASADAGSSSLADAGSSSLADADAGETSAPEAAVGCLDDRGCPAGRMCSRGACVQCVVDAHCAGREEPRCDARGRCVECTASSECRAGQVCAPWGECELTCTGDAQCVARLRCDPNFHVCLECAEDADCNSSGAFCDEGVCTRCAGNPDCPN